jgi:hypothetical protein
MKITVFALCFMCATAAFGQLSAISNQPQPLVMVDHPARASQHPMAEEQTLLTADGFTYAHGERPLWEFASTPHNVPLGDIARDLKREHLTAKKADKVWND